MTPNDPGNLAVHVVTNTSLNLTWDDTNSGTTGYYIEQSPNNVDWTPIRFSGRGTTSALVTGLTPNTTYYFRVTAFTGNFGIFEEDETVWLSMDGEPTSFSFSVNQGLQGFAKDAGGYFLQAYDHSLSGVLYDEALAGFDVVNFVGFNFGPNTGIVQNVTTVTIDTNEGHTELSNAVYASNSTPLVSPPQASAVIGCGLL